MIAAVVTKAGLTASNGEARRLAQGGGLRLNDAAVSDGAQLLTEADLKARMEQQRDHIKTFKVGKGQCHDIDGTDKAGQQVEIDFDPVTTAVLEPK